MSYLTFNEVPNPDARAVTKWWEARSGAILVGRVKWFASWRRYCFFPNAQCVFDQDCLREVSQFIEDRTREHKEARKRASGAA